MSPSLRGSNQAQRGAVGFSTWSTGLQPFRSCLKKGKTSNKLEQRTVHRASTAKPTLGGNDIPLGTRFSDHKEIYQVVWK